MKKSVFVVFLVAAILMCSGASAKAKGTGMVEFVSVLAARMQSKNITLPPPIASRTTSLDDIGILTSWSKDFTMYADPQTLEVASVMIGSDGKTDEDIMQVLCVIAALEYPLDKYPVNPLETPAEELLNKIIDNQSVETDVYTYSVGVIDGKLFITAKLK